MATPDLYQLALGLTMNYALKSIQPGLNQCYDRYGLPLSHRSAVNTALSNALLDVASQTLNLAKPQIGRAGNNRHRNSGVRIEEINPQPEGVPVRRGRKPRTPSVRPVTPPPAYEDLQNEVEPAPPAYSENR